MCSSTGPPACRPSLEMIDCTGDARDNVTDDELDQIKEDVRSDTEEPAAKK